MSSPTLHIGDSGWRAVYTDSFTLEKLSAIVLSLAEIYPKQKVLIGYDNRFLSPEFAKHIAHLLKGAAWKADLLSDVFPTPGIARLVKDSYDWGLVITASHNPFYYNGLKILNSKGLLSERKLNDKIQEKAVQKIENEKLPGLYPLQFDPNSSFSQASSAYLSQIFRHIDKKHFKKSKLKVVWDSFGGTTNKLFPIFFKKLSLTNSGLHWPEDPTFGHRRLEPDEKSLQSLRKLLLQKKYPVGIATDLDGDRFAVLDEKGRFMLPNIIGPLLTWYLLEFRKEKGTVYQTVSASQLTQQICNQFNVDLKEMPVGFQAMGQAMQANPQALLGMEETGGIAYAPHLCFKDGLMAHAILLEMLASQKKPLSRLIEDMHKNFGRYYYHRIDLSLETQQSKSQWLEESFWENITGEKTINLSQIDGQKFYFKSGWVLVRDSKTEPLLRIYFESPKKEWVKQILKALE